MSFVTQEDIFATMTPVIDGVFKEFADWTGTQHKVEWLPNMTYADAMMLYGSDKPDMRNPLVIADVTDVFKRDDVTFNAFKNIIASGGVVRAIRAPKVGGQPRSFFDKLNDWARGEGAPGLGYILFEGAEGKGPIAKFLPAEAQAALRAAAKLEDGDAIFFVCDKEEKAAKFAGRARDRICDDMGIREQGVFRFHWIVDFPMYEMDEKTGKVDFSHNPFSMPRGGLDALAGDPLAVVANQYDCVCNGFEIASGGIRNHRPDIMEKAFAIAGYDRAVLEKKFGGMLNAFKYGAPPHGGCAFGIDRLVMLLANEPNLREVYAFVMNGAYEDLMMGSPSEATPEQLKDLHLKVVMPLKAENTSEKEKKTA
jgi:aspartyl-tRNA synthetase